VLGRVERSLDLRLERTAAVYKRRTVGMSTDRGTWIRLECRGPDRDTGQGWGLEAARIAHGVPAPRWFAGLSWFDEIRQVSWRADEIEYVADQPLKNAYAAEGLPDTWWTALSDALEQLAACHTTRRATPDCGPITHERVQGAITKIFPGLTFLELDEWSSAHGDLVWSNLTGPTLRIMDFEDFGFAPRGLDAACLWFASLLHPHVERRVHASLAGDLESRSGKIMRLFKCAELLAWAGDAERLHEPATREAQLLIRDLESTG
jgi:hypothetical protein